MRWYEKLQQRWKVDTLWDVIAILIVFTLTGFSVVYLKHLFGIGAISPMYYRIAFYILILFLYQIVLLFWGFIFGKFRFFLEFEKKMFRRIFKMFKK
ncbi:MAG: prolipoprotein diacylglyceryl transferase [Bacteroidia bacterium]|nr:prolipoprotein diacylglyceryl transferase [Bacteroidia bacterium]